MSITNEQLNALAEKRNKAKLAYLREGERLSTTASQGGNNMVGNYENLKSAYENASKAYNDAYNGYLAANKTSTQDIVNHYAKLEGKLTESPLTPPETMAGNTPSPSTNYYDALMKNREKAFQNARNKAMDNAKLAYQRAVNPYGVVAEGMANAGLSSKGGYGQRVSVNAYNNYANAIANAENTYQQSMDEAELQIANQKWQEEQEANKRAYEMKLLEMQQKKADEANSGNLINSMAQVVDVYVQNGALSSTGRETAINRLKSIYPSATDEQIELAIDKVIAYYRENNEK